VSTLNIPGDATTRELVAAMAEFGPGFVRWMHAGGRGQSTPSWPRTRLLQVLHHTGPQMMTALREPLGITARSVTALVDGLESEGLVARSPHPTDRRSTIVDLTDAGREAVAGAMQLHTARSAELFSRLDEGDQAELLRIVRLLVDELRSLGAGEGCGPGHVPVA
jgi:DNA-binding MarR family transcriptional regulator